MKQVGPDTARRMDLATTIIARALALIFGFGMLGVSIWCFRVAREVATPTPGVTDAVSAAQRQEAPIAFWGTWLVMGAPPALLGLWVLGATLKGTAAHRWLQQTFVRAEELVAKPAGSRQRESQALANMPDDVR